MQCVRDRCPALFSPAKYTMQSLHNCKFPACGRLAVMGSRTAPLVPSACVSNVTSMLYIGEKRHMVAECPFLQGVWDMYVELLANHACTKLRSQADITVGL